MLASEREIYLKKLKIAIIVSLCLLLAITPVWGDNIIEEAAVSILSAILDTIMNVISGVANIVAINLMKAMSVDIQWYEKNITTAFGDLSGWIVWIAFGLGAFIVAWKLFSMLFAPIKGEQATDSVGGLITRSIIYIPLVFVVQDFAKLVFSEMQKIFVQINAATVGNGGWEFSHISYEGMQQRPGIAEMMAEASEPLVGMIVVFGLSFVIVWNFLKLLLELGQKFVAMFVYVYLSPLACACGVSSGTSAITKKAFSLFISSGILYMLNAWVLKIAISILGAIKFTSDMTSILCWALFAYGYMKIAQQLDDIFNAVGATNVKMSGGLLEEMFAMGGAMRGAMAVTRNGLALTGATLKARGGYHDALTNRANAMGVGAEGDGGQGIANPSTVQAAAGAAAATASGTASAGPSAASTVRTVDTGKKVPSDKKHPSGGMAGVDVTNADNSKTPTENLSKVDLAHPGETLARNFDLTHPIASTWGTSVPAAHGYNKTNAALGKAIINKAQEQARQEGKSVMMAGLKARAGLAALATTAVVGGMVGKNRFKNKESVDDLKTNNDMRAFAGATGGGQNSPMPNNEPQSGFQKAVMRSAPEGTMATGEKDTHNLVNYNNLDRESEGTRDFYAVQTPTNEVDMATRTSAEYDSTVPHEITMVEDINNAGSGSFAAAVPITSCENDTAYVMGNNPSINREFEAEGYEVGSNKDMFTVSMQDKHTAIIDSAATRALYDEYPSTERSYMPETVSLEGSYSAAQVATVVANPTNQDRWSPELRNTTDGTNLATAATKIGSTGDGTIYGKKNLATGGYKLHGSGVVEKVHTSSSSRNTGNNTAWETNFKSYAHGQDNRDLQVRDTKIETHNLKYDADAKTYSSSQFTFTSSGNKHGDKVKSRYDNYTASLSKEFKVQDVEKIFNGDMTPQEAKDKGFTRDDIKHIGNAMQNSYAYDKTGNLNVGDLTRKYNLEEIQNSYQTPKNNK